MFSLICSPRIGLAARVFVNLLRVRVQGGMFLAFVAALFWFLLSLAMFLLICSFWLMTHYCYFVRRRCRSCFCSFVRNFGHMKDQIPSFLDDNSCKICLGSFPSCSDPQKCKNQYMFNIFCLFFAHRYNLRLLTGRDLGIEN